MIGTGTLGNAGAIMYNGRRVASGNIAGYPNIVATAAHTFYDIGVNSSGDCTCSLKGRINPAADFDFRMADPPGYGDTIGIVSSYPPMNRSTGQAPHCQYVVKHAIQPRCFIDPHFDTVALILDYEHPDAMPLRVSHESLGDLEHHIFQMVSYPGALTNRQAARADCRIQSTEELRRQLNGFPTVHFGLAS
jgi:hypothetical protein